ncbi:MAG: hypothetical protein WC736_15880 [Gallionella sp.]|jgi:hypothetical protein
MDGATLYRSLREAIGEPSGSQYLDLRTAYQYIWDAAIAVVQKTRCLTATATLTTVADQQAYVLPADFLDMALQDTTGREFIKYYDGSAYSFLSPCEYEVIIYGNQTTSVTHPSRYAISDKPTLYAQITGTATSAGAASGGKSTLTDTSGLFTTTDYVSAGDVIHNTTSDDSGIVLSVDSATALSTAMFDNTTGAAAGWTQNDAYVIQPQGRWQLSFDPPPSTAAHTATVYYVQRPAPVSHSYGVYRIPSHFQTDLIDYAAFRYKYRDKEPGFGDAFQKQWMARLGQTASSINKAVDRSGFKMRMSNR